MSRSAFTKKSIADVTRRKGRSLLVILGIMIGVLGLTAVNSASSTIGNAFAYIQDQSAVPDLAYSVAQAVPSSVITTLKSNPNLAILETYRRYLTTWQVPGSRQIPLQINGYDDFQQINSECSSSPVVVSLVQERSSWTPVMTSFSMLRLGRS